MLKARARASGCGGVKVRGAVVEGIGLGEAAVAACLDQRIGGRNVEWLENGGRELFCRTAREEYADEQPYDVAHRVLMPPD